MKILSDKEHGKLLNQASAGEITANDALREVTHLQANLRRTEAEVEKRDREVERLERELGQARMAAGFRALPVVPDQVMANALKLVDEENGLWRTVHSFIRMQGKVEQTSLCVPGLSNEAAQYNRGRLAMLEDLEAALVQVWVEQRVAA
jgi:hypothetical protein